MALPRFFSGNLAAMAADFGRSAARIALALALTGIGACQLPPDFVADASAPHDSAGFEGGGDAFGERNDPFAALRAACTFRAGAPVTHTLPIAESERAAIPIQHVIVVMKENRSFDHLLGNLAASGQPEADAVTPSFTNEDKAGVGVAPFRLHTTCVNRDPGHQWDDMHRQVNGGLMDGFVANGADSTGSDGHFVMGYYENRDLPFYYWLANTFAINDRHFASARTGTWPDRNFLLLGTADGVKCTYCGLPSPATPTIFDALDDAAVSWGAFTDSDPFDGTLGWMPPHVGLRTLADFLASLADGTLPSVAFVDSIAFVEDEHPTADVQLGEAWTKRVYDATVASPLWPSTALIWTYDEAGGFADHVPPPNQACVARPGNPKDTAFVELGVRVPLVVVSPWARPHFVSHVVQEHTSITRFIEAVFGLPALTSRDANSPALLDMFDFGAAAPSLLNPGAAPAAGVGGCNGNIVLATDHPSYPSTAAQSVAVSFRGVPMPRARDRIGVYKYGDVPTEANQQEPLAWGYIGGQGHNPGAAPASGTVVVDETVAASGTTWPLPPGLWIAYYLPALASGADGHAPAASIDIEVEP
jgi:phospholipase C